MQLCHFHLPGLGSRIGRIVADRVVDLTASQHPHFSTLTAFLQASINTPAAAMVEDVSLPDLPAIAYAELDSAPTPGTPHLLPPVDRQEVWAAGVTYAWSREARVREAQSKEVYVRVYEADRPELFFKSLAEKVVGPHTWIGIRGDSTWDVPEPELALLLNPQMQIVGYTAGNDVSSRSIEGENPLYLPQAKIYRHSCALGPVITLVDGGVDGSALVVHLTIRRGGEIAFEGESNTANMNRRLDELAGYLGRHNDFPHGAVLLTGTGIVPGDDFTLQDGDTVSVEIENVGVLVNPVRTLSE